MGKSFNTGNLTNIIGYSGSNVAITGSVNISGTVVSTGTSLVSGSGQISYTGITNIPSGIVSGSAQTIANLPSGVVSGSAQVTTFGFGTTGSNTFQGSQTINGSLVVTGSLTAQQFIVSSSVTYLTESFASGSHKFGDSSDDNHDFTGSVRISGSIVSTTTALVSGSSQVDVMSTTNIARLATTGSNVFTGAITGTSATFSSTLKVGGALGNFLIDSYTTSKIGIRSWTDIAGTTNNFFVQNNASYNYGILGVVSASGVATGDVYALGYSPSAGTSMTPVINWTSGGNAWSSGSFGVGVSPNYGPLDVRSSSTSISTLDGVAGFFKNTPKGGGLSVRVHDTQVDLAATWFYGATNMDLTLTTVATDAVYRERMRIQASDGAMAFNTSIVAVRSYLFKALSGRQLAIEALESGGVHSIYLRPSSSGRNLITSNYFSGSVYLPLALSGRENDSDLVLHANGNISVNSSTDIGTKFQINGANHIEMATFAATSASASAIVSANGGYVQFSNATARHLSNSNVFTATTDGIQILKAGILHITFSQDITTAGTTGYVAGYIRKNTVSISENLITNTNGQWDGINGVGTIDVNASDVIGFYFNAADITSFDPGTWSQYSFIWTPR